MDRQVAGVLYVVAMIAIIVGVDFIFFRHQFWERLIVNIGIVLVFAAFFMEIPQASVIAMEAKSRSSPFSPNGKPPGSAGVAVVV